MGEEVKVRNRFPEKWVIDDTKPITIDKELETPKFEVVETDEDETE